MLFRTMPFRVHIYYSSCRIHTVMTSSCFEEAFIYALITRQRKEISEVVLYPFSLMHCLFTRMHGAFLSRYIIYKLRMRAWLMLALRMCSMVGSRLRRVGSGDETRSRFAFSGMARGAPDGLWGVACETRYRYVILHRLSLTPHTFVMVTLNIAI